LLKIDESIKLFKAPEFSVDKGYNDLKSILKSKPKKSISWFKPILKIAAAIVLGLSLFYYISHLDSEITTQIAEQSSVILPDASSVELNANSLLTYNKKSWSDSREVQLYGEAFFKVAKGETFDVITNEGLVRVLGTQFNIKQRAAYFEVTCYEGLVAVTYQDKSVKLYPGQSFLAMEGKVIPTKTVSTNQPYWLNGESNFNSIPLHYVLSEIENQYRVNFDTTQINTARLFTGSFTHNNLDLALQAVLIPLNLSYKQSDNTIILKSE
jgi:ferric-dicitrate binding protein FerR (iron transport regulator)